MKFIPIILMSLFSVVGMGQQLSVAHLEANQGSSLVTCDPVGKEFTIEFINSDVNLLTELWFRVQLDLDTRSTALKYQVISATDQSNNSYTPVLNEVDNRYELSGLNIGQGESITVNYKVVVGCDLFELPGSELGINNEVQFGYETTVGNPVQLASDYNLIEPAYSYNIETIPGENYKVTRNGIDETSHLIHFVINDPASLIALGNLQLVTEYGTANNQQFPDQDIRFLKARLEGNGQSHDIVRSTVNYNINGRNSKLLITKSDLEAIELFANNVLEFDLYITYEGRCNGNGMASVLTAYGFNYECPLEGTFCDDVQTAKPFNTVAQSAPTIEVIPSTAGSLITITNGASTAYECGVFTRSVTFKNMSDVSVPVTRLDLNNVNTQVTDLKIIDDAGTVIYMNATPSSIINLSSDNITVKSGEEINITFNVTLINLQNSNSHYTWTFLRYDRGCTETTVRYSPEYYLQKNSRLYLSPYSNSPQDNNVFFQNADGPTDVNSNEQAVFSFAPGISTINSQLISDANCTSGKKFFIRVTIPSGWTYVTNTAVYYTGYGENNNANSLTATVNLEGDLIIELPAGGLVGNNRFDIQLQAPAGAVSSTLPIQWKYVKTCENTGCDELILSETTYSTYYHNGTTGDFSTLDFSIRRNTYGFNDADVNGDFVTRNNLLTENYSFYNDESSNIEQYTVIEGDQFIMSASAQTTQSINIGTTISAVFDFTGLPTAFRNLVQDRIELSVEGVPVPATSLTWTESNSIYILQYTTNIIINANSDIKASVWLTYPLGNNLSSAGIFTLSQLRAELTTGSPLISENSQGQKFTFINSRFFANNSTIEKESNEAICDPTDRFKLTYSYSTSNNGVVDNNWDFYPNEFRAKIALSTVSLKLNEEIDPLNQIEFEDQNSSFTEVPSSTDNINYLWIATDDWPIYDMKANSSFSVFTEAESCSFDLSSYQNGVQAFIYKELNENDLQLGTVDENQSGYENAIPTNISTTISNTTTGFRFPKVNIWKASQSNFNGIIQDEIEVNFTQSFFIGRQDRNPELTYWLILENPIDDQNPDVQIQINSIEINGVTSGTSTAIPFKTIESAESDNAFIVYIERESGLTDGTNDITFNLSYTCSEDLTALNSKSVNLYFEGGCGTPISQGSYYDPNISPTVFCYRETQNVKKETINVNFFPADLDIQTEITLPLSADGQYFLTDPCDGIPYEVTLNHVGDGGSVGDIILWLEQNDETTEVNLSETITLEITGLEENGTSLSVPTIAPTYIEANRVGWYIKDLIGPDFLLTNDESLKINFTALTSCDFRSGLPLSLNVSAFNNCGNQVGGSNFDARAVLFNAFNPLDQLGINITGDDLTESGKTYEATVTVQNNHPSLSLNGLNDQVNRAIVVTLPEDVSIVSGSAEAFLNNGTATDPVESLFEVPWAEYDQVAWVLPGNLLAGQSYTIRFEISIPVDYELDYDCFELNAVAVMISEDVSCSSQSTTCSEIYAQTDIDKQRTCFISSFCADCITSFSPEPGQQYVLSAWVTQTQQNATTFEFPSIYLEFPDLTDQNGDMVILGPYQGSGQVIDGWQRIEEAFIIPAGARKMNILLKNDAPLGSLNAGVNFDDIRVHPFNSNMKSYVYDPETYRLMAELDENNYATFYEYDEEGALVRVKKETVRGVKTIQESRNNTVKQ